MGAYFIAILFDINYLAWPDPISWKCVGLPPILYF